MLDLKKTEDLSFMILESDAKFEEKLTCALENNEEISKFSREHLKVSTFEL